MFQWCLWQHYKRNSHGEMVVSLDRQVGCMENVTHLCGQSNNLGMFMRK